MGIQSIDAEDDQFETEDDIPVEEGREFMKIVATNPKKRRNDEEIDDRHHLEEGGYS